MAKFLKSLKNILKSVISKDPYEKTDLESIYFKKAKSSDVPRERPLPKSLNNVVVEDKIKSLNRTILTGMTKRLVEARIAQLVYESNFNALRPEIKDVCEIIDYACRNNTPVRVNYIKMILPTIEIPDKDILNEKTYEEWLKNKGEQENIPQSTFHIEDEYGLREKENSKRGKKDYSDWRSNNQENQWKKQ